MVMHESSITGWLSVYSGNKTLRQTWMSMCINLYWMSCCSCGKMCCVDGISAISRPPAVIEGGCCSYLRRHISEYDVHLFVHSHMTVVQHHVLFSASCKLAFVLILGLITFLYGSIKFWNIRNSRYTNWKK